MKLWTFITGIYILHSTIIHMIYLLSMRCQLSWSFWPRVEDWKKILSYGVCWRNIFFNPQLMIKHHLEKINFMKKIRYLYFIYTPFIFFMSYNHDQYFKKIHDLKKIANSFLALFSDKLLRFCKGCVPLISLNRHCCVFVSR